MIMPNRKIATIAKRLEAANATKDPNHARVSAMTPLRRNGTSIFI